MPLKKKGKKANAAGVLGSISGAGSIISAHNVCHALCLAVVAFLSLFGIMVASDVLMWLQSYNLIFWSMGLAFLAISLLLYMRFKGCMSEKLIIANAGLVVMGFPFLSGFQTMFWLAGGLIVAYSIILYLNNKFLLMSRIGGKNGK